MVTLNVADLNNNCAQEDEKRKKRQDRVYSIRRSWAGHVRKSACIQ